MDTIKTTDKGAQIIEVIQMVVAERNSVLSKIQHNTERLEILDNHIKNLRDALHREHLSVMEALGL